MQLADRIAHAFKSSGRGLDYQQPLRGALDLALPAVYRFDLRHNVDACCKLPLHQRLSKLTSLVGGTGGGEDDTGVGHGSLRLAVYQLRHLREFRHEVIWQSWFLLSGKIQLPLDARCEIEVH